MNKIYIVDLIGSHCGMDYYTQAFNQLLLKNSFSSQVLSPDKNGKNHKFFPNIFKGNFIRKIILLFFSDLKFFFFLLTHKGHSIYLSYGEKYDLLMILNCLFFRKKIIVDIHEVAALKYDENSYIYRLFKFIYRRLVKYVIYHSDRTYEKLSKNKNLRMLYVPHINYNFNKRYNIDNLSDDIKDVFNDPKKIKFLFFGNLSHVKGIDIVIESFKNANSEITELVIAGKNVESINFSHIKNEQNIHVFDRHINNDELTYLYSKCDYVLLPYRKSSQSGIMAMAEFFQKPMILSDIPYFVKKHAGAPSIGIITPIQNYSETIIQLINGNFEHSFYTSEDLEKLHNTKQINLFLKELDSITN